jgi:hypothetical protein
MKTKLFFICQGLIIKKNYKSQLNDDTEYIHTYTYKVKSIKI